MKSNTPHAFLPALLALVLIGAGCTQSQPTSTATPVPTIEIKEVKTSEIEPTETTPTKSEPSETTEESDVLKVNIEDGNFFFSPSTITAAAGQTVEVTITGHEGFHTFVISDIGLKKTLKDGASFTFVAPKTAGSYEILCDIGNHKAQGMVGMLIVK